jgi:hypothetical protein
MGDTLSRVCRNAYLELPKYVVRPDGAAYGCCGLGSQQPKEAVMNLSLRLFRRTLAIACVCALVVLPAASALAAPAPATPAPANPVDQPTSAPIQVQLERTNYGARTLSIVLASSALLIAIGGAAYAVHVGHAQRRVLGS